MPTSAKNNSGDLLTSLLRDVSRSFYITLRALPKAIGPQIGLAYLLARATDTIADTDLVPLETRLVSLDRLRARILGELATPIQLGNLAEQQGLPAERVLLNRIEEAITVLNSLAEPDRLLVRDVLTTITSGQELDLKRFAGANAQNIIALREDAELDDYTYRVAGCVGDFWTRMCLAHLRAPASMDRAKLIANGIRFGKGLQLVNILRDLPADLSKGRCYIPVDALNQMGLKTSDLTQPASIQRFRPLYNGYLQRARDHLVAGWEYTNALPFGWLRVRLPCAWPILIGVRTLGRLEKQNPLDSSLRIKATRAEVKKIMLRTVLTYPFPTLFQRSFERAAKF